MKYFLLFFSVTLLCSCNHAKKKEHKSLLENIKEISFVSVNQEPMELAKSCYFLMLEDTCRESLFANISKLKIKGDRIYILDFSGSKALHVFDLNGKFIRNIGERGAGPGEYKKIFDFDVDDSAIYIYDGPNRNMLIYNQEGQFLKKKELPHSINSFSLLKDGGYLFSLPKTLGEAKVIATDSLFDIRKEYFQFTEKDMGDKFNIGIFQESSDGIVYNRPINDTIFVFSKNGDIQQAYYINFENKRVPDELRKSYQELVAERELHDFQYFYSTPIYIKNSIIGNIFSGDTKALVNIDTKQGLCNMKLLKEQNFNLTDPYLPLTTLNDSTIVSFLNDGIYNVINKNHKLEEKFIKHMEDGGTILCFYNLN